MGKFCGKSQFPQSFGRIERRERERERERKEREKRDRDRDRETERQRDRERKMARKLAYSVSQKMFEFFCNFHLFQALNPPCSHVYSVLQGKCSLFS